MSYLVGGKADSDPLSRLGLCVIGTWSVSLEALTGGLFSRYAESETCNESQAALPTGTNGVASLAEIAALVPAREPARACPRTPTADDSSMVTTSATETAGVGPPPCPAPMLLLRNN